MTWQLLITHLLAIAFGGAAALAYARVRRSAPAASAAPATNVAAGADDRGVAERFRAAAQAAGMSYWDWDLEGDEVRTDARMINPELYGRVGDVIDRRHFLSQMVHPEDRQAFIDRMEALFTEPCTRFVHHYRMLRPDGAVVYLKLNGIAFRNQRGKTVRLFALNQDVTEQTLIAQQLEAQTRKQESLLRQMRLANQAAGCGAWTWEIAEDRFTGDAFITQGLNLERPDLGGARASFRALIHPDDRKRCLAEIDAALAGGDEAHTTQYRIVLPTGVTRHVRAHAYIERAADGAAVRMLGITTDITNEIQTTAMLQRQAEQERQLVERLGMATRAAGISSWEIDLRDRRFLWVENEIDGLENSLEEGDSADHFLARIEPEDRNRFMDAMRDAIARGVDHIAYRYRMRSRTGALRHLQTHARILLDDRGRPASALGVTWEVTREVEAAEELQKQAERQRKLNERLTLSTEAAAISCWEVDLTSGRFTFADPSIVPLHGVESFEGTTEDFFNHIHTEDRAHFMRAVRDSRASKHDRFSLRYRVPKPGGRTIHIQTHVHVSISDDGRPVRLLGVSWDVTREVEASEQLTLQAQQLRDAERRVERASRSSSEGHWEVDLATKRVWCSSSYHTLLGYAAGELPELMRDFNSLVHPEDRDALNATLVEHIDNGAPFETDVRLFRRSGEARWFRMRGMVERDPQQGAGALSGSIQDIHDQKFAEDALRQAQQRFERAIHGTQDGLWELDNDGAAWCSPRLIELLGYAEDELPANTNFLHHFLHHEDAERVAAAGHEHFENNAPYDVELRLVTKSGDYRWYRARAAAERDAAGAPLRLSGSLQDITDARAARQALLHATQAAESANRAKSEFLANVSHEIRTPLNGVIGMTGLLLDTTLDRTQRDYAETIRTSADSLLMVINDILDFSKIEAGKLDIEALEFDLHDVIEDVGAMMAFQAAAKNLELVVNIHGDAPARVIGDPQRVRQCLLNLLGNAVKFTRAGEIVIEARRIGEADARALMRFEVRDTGIGVAPEVLGRLFQPFVQADSSTTRHFGGTGLGLSIVRRLVEMMGGEVGVESVVGKGSTFWFTLPLKAIASAPTSEEIDLARLGRRALVVDDNETNRRVLAGQLMRAGYEVSLAAGGVEALSLMRQAAAASYPYEVVLADYKMRDMDGDVLGERINADAQLSSARLIMLTSMDRQGDVHRFASLGFAAYLTKPVRSRELLECMDRVLARGAESWRLQTQPIVTRGALASAEGARRYECRVLLVEDNAVNQKVAVRFLERMGCAVRVADNGAEGLKAYMEATYDLVLMDLQMPVMDGLTAAQRIRESEAGARRTPIVALTANAMSGQLERCLAAGMDGFLTKPIEIARLHEMLERYGLSPGAAESASAAAAPTDAPVVLARLNEITDGDPEFAHELAMTFIDSGRQVFDEIRAALDGFDRTALSRGAHKLKGASANIHAERLRELAWKLESQAAQLDQPSLAALIADLQQEFERAAEFLKAQAPAAPRKAV